MIFEACQIPGYKEKNAHNNFVIDFVFNVRSYTSFIDDEKVTKCNKLLCK